MYKTQGNFVLRGKEVKAEKERRTKAEGLILPMVTEDSNHFFDEKRRWEIQFTASIFLSSGTPITNVV